MTTDTEIVLLRAEDTMQAATLHSRCFEGHSSWSAKDMRATLELTTTLALGLEADRDLAGLLLVQRVAPDAEILTICVDPDHRRKGLAQALFGHALTLLGPHGVDRLLLDVDADNGGAISFYERNGFSRDGVRKNYYQRDDGQRSDAVLMSRSLAGQISKSKA